MERIRLQEDRFAIGANSLLMRAISPISEGKLALVQSFTRRANSRTTGAKFSILLETKCSTPIIPSYAISELRLPLKDSN